MNVGILGVGKYVFEKIVINFDLEKIMDIFDEWIRIWIGIEERRIVCDDEYMYDLVYEVVKVVIKNVGFILDDIDLFIVVIVI